MSAAGFSQKGNPSPLSVPSGAPPDLVVTELDSRFVTAYRADGSMAVCCTVCDLWQPATRGHVTDILRSHTCEAAQ